MARNNRGVLTRPSVEEVFAYRKYVDNHISKVLEGDQSQELLDVLEIGVNHEQQHQELMITMKYLGR